MKQDSKNPKHYIADEGMVLRRKVDGFIMGRDIYLCQFIDGTKDTIDNYEEITDPKYDKGE